MEPRCSWKNLGSCQWKGEIDWSYRRITIGSLQVDDCGSTLEKLHFKVKLNHLQLHFSIDIYHDYSILFTICSRQSSYRKNTLWQAQQEANQKIFKIICMSSYEPQPPASVPFGLVSPQLRSKIPVGQGGLFQRWTIQRGDLFESLTHISYIHISSYINMFRTNELW